ncbi:unnamed protein product [marine sediment metagenome]|uniref:DUF5678 domain-containing protein n=1 Tax=marine sediment metagenome TaxID=412755 RepID=X1T9F4_9ZZZZ
MPITEEAQNMVSKVGGEETVELRIRHFEEDFQYLQSLWHELMDKYLNQWVAVYDKSLVAHGKNIHELRKKLSSKGVPQNEAVIDYISSERKSMLL